MARTTIDGTAIKDESITEDDIKDGAIKAAELSPDSIDGQPQISDGDATNDKLLIWDASDSTLKKIAPDNLGLAGGGAPAGADTQIQYNNNGSFGASSNLVWDNSSDTIKGFTKLQFNYNNGQNYIREHGSPNPVDLEIKGHQYLSLWSETRIQFEMGVSGYEICEIGPNGFEWNAHDYFTGDIADFKLKSANNTHALFMDYSADNIGIGTASPKTGLDIHHDPTSLADNTGGGECVTFGTGATTAGKLYYLNGTAWAEIDASAPATGADQMVGIALGSSSADGILIRGFFDATTYLASFSAGKAVYMSETAASMTTVAPTSAAAVVRIMGYCTDTANVIYFNPSNNWIELI